MRLALTAALLAILAVAFLFPRQGAARTWFVEKDGSGEFVSIHNAMEACTAGDTIRIGPGRYDDFHTFTAPAWTTEVIVGVTKDNLTFIGDSDSTTIIGPTEMYLPGTIPEPMAIASVENVNAKFVNVRVENARNGIYWAQGRVEVECSRFEGCMDGMYLFNSGGAAVEDSEFYSNESESVGIITFSPCGPVSISGCTFGGPGVNEKAIGLNGTTGVNIQNCCFYLKNGVAFSASSGGIENCVSGNSVALSVAVSNSSQVSVEGNLFHGSFASIYVTGWSTLSGSGNVFSGGEDLATIYISSQSQVTLHGNDIIKNGAYAAKIGQYFYEIVTNDLTGNYWGTSDSDSIASWIWDYNDAPITRAIIDFEPFSSTPLPTEKPSLGGFKSMFR